MISLSPTVPRNHEGKQPERAGGAFGGALGSCGGSTPAGQSDNLSSEMVLSASSGPAQDADVLMHSDDPAEQGQCSKTLQVLLIECKSFTSGPFIPVQFTDCTCRTLAGYCMTHMQSAT